ncbi:MAG: hypothetical protein LUQ25_07230 [Methanoregulaceae archaeon]|nr:hypothetical protein [Methanoregulaceae archaeon]
MSKTDVGRRLFHVQREKGVEGAVKKIKTGIGPDWKSFTTDEIRVLGHLLQCTWNNIERDVWDKIPFGKMTKKDVVMILSHGKDIGPGRNPGIAEVQKIKGILLNLS